MKLTTAGLCCAVLLVVCGCGGSAGTAVTSQPPDPERTGVAENHPSSADAAESTTHAQGLLLRPTPRPPGVSAQFDFVGGAGPGACFGEGNPAQIRVIVEPFPTASESTAEGFNEKGIATYGQPVDVCFDGMGRGPISVTVDGPHGFARSGELPALPATRSYHYQNEWTSFDWVPAIEPSWPLGRYVISAHAGSITRSHTLTLVSPRRPGLRVLGPSTDPGHNSVPPDSHATIFLTGFKGGSTVKLVAYRVMGFGGQAKFFSTAKVPIPPGGNTMLEIPTGAEKSSKEPGPTFIVTTSSGGRTLFAPFSVFDEQKWPNLVVGLLPQSS